MDRATPTVPVAPPSREAEIAARQIAEQLWAQVEDITHGNYDAATFRVRAANWVNIIAAHLQQARQERDSARDERSRILDEYRKALAQSEAALQQAQHENARLTADRAKFSAWTDGYREAISRSFSEDGTTSFAGLSDLAAERTRELQQAREALEARQAQLLKEHGGNCGDHEGLAYQYDMEAAAALHEIGLALAALKAVR